ncbi:MAG: OmpA family protein [Polyangiaceae bacterium]|nr:OmpA family protein [Polyangiaceae bacterium]MCB9607574.1 OmpA family protein [Polyangiaceae bacterium]
MNRQDDNRRAGSPRPKYPRGFMLGATLGALFCAVACAAPVQENTDPNLPPAGADNEYNPSLGEPAKYSARYVQIDVGPAEAGCPTEIPFFDFDKAKARPQDHLELSGLAECLNDPNHRDAKILLIGHTDTRGSTAYNQRLGLERAQTVKDVLVAYGISPDRIELKSAGESQARAGNDPLIAQGYDRRVDVVQLEIKRPY